MSDYDDIINLPHHQSKTHPHMSLHDRAAQFAPFAALTGYDDAVKEAGRLTDSRIELDETELAELDFTLLKLSEHISEHPAIRLIYFVQDDKKDGGEYIAYDGRLSKIDYAGKALIFEDNKIISLSDILKIVV